MAVDSTLELYTTLFGWLFYNSVWDVLVATGIVFLPFLGLLLRAVTRAYAQEDADSAGHTALRTVEVECFVAFLVIVLAAVPVVPLNAVDLSFTPRAVIGTPAQPTATVADSRTTYGGGVSFPGAPASVRVPVLWYAVISFSAGFNRAVMEAVPPTIDYRGYANALGITTLTDPALRHAINDFYRDCFVEARSRFLRERPQSPAITALLQRFGEQDPDWLGSHVYLETPGYYDSLRASTIREGYPWSPLRDVEWTEADHPLYGKPYCTTWWQDLQQAILTEASAIDLQAAAAEPDWDPVQRRDTITQLALLNSPPRWTTRGYDLAYANFVDFDTVDFRPWLALQNAGQQGLAAYSLAKTSLSFAAYLRVFLEGAPMLQALVLMGLYTMLPFFVLACRYQLEVLTLGSVALFTVKSWSVWWFFAWWVDQNLIQAFYPDPGSLTTLFSTDLTLKRVVLNFLTGSLYLLLPLLLSAMLGLAGMRALSHIDSASSALTRGLSAVRSIQPRLNRIRGVTNRRNGR